MTPFRTRARFTLVLALTTLMIAPAWATHRSEAEAAIAAARAAHERAVEAGAEVAETAALIERAAGLLPSRQYTKAVRIAEQAIAQDTHAYEQAQRDETEPGAAAAEAAIAAAEAARARADAVGGEWRDTAKLIAEAQGLARAGDFEAAIALAERARRQGELGHAQALRERDADFPDYIRQP
ncbi:hypothetical protein McPS_32180 [Marichromatium sp. PS1]|uniref:hypothetical protein n=1 Tax=Marichromatium sp. PS1 TaxID=3138932 RepID=UPI0032E7853C